MVETQPDFCDPAVQADPFASYEAARQQGPVYRDPQTGFYFVLDYDLLREVAGDSATFSSATGVLSVRSGDLGEEIRRIQEENGIFLVPALLVTDPPLHKFHRGFVDKAFSPSRVRKLETYLGGVIDDLITGFENEPVIDFVQRMALMVPVYVVADLIGADRSMVHDIKRWSDASAAGVDPSLTREQTLAAIREACGLQRFILDQTHRYRQAPADNLLSDVANGKVDGRQLSESEIVTLMEQVFVAGHETTTNTMSLGMLRMIQTPGLEALLRSNPQEIGAFVEEILRLDSPLQGMFRLTTRDVELGGTHIPAHSVVVVRWGAGNRDPKRFANAAEIDLKRPNLRQHLAFGTGIHFCVGNQLARAELRISFERLLERLGNFRLADGAASVERASHYFIHGLKRLDIAFERRAG